MPTAQITAAAAATRQSVSAFVLDAAAQAREVRDCGATTELDAQHFDGGLQPPAGA